VLGSSGKGKGRIWESCGDFFKYLWKVATGKMEEKRANTAMVVEISGCCHTTTVSLIYSTWMTI